MSSAHAVTGVSPSAAAKYSRTRAISGSLLIVGLLFTFVQLRYTPNCIATDNSTILPSWVGWAAFVLAFVSAVAYNVTDYLEWWGRREEVRT